MTQRYDTYKDSGVQWLGEIPGHWEVPAFKRVCKLKSGNTNIEEIANGGVPFVRVSDMNLPENKLYIETSKTFIDKNNCTNSLFPVGSVIFPKRGGAILTNKRRIVTKEICCDLNIMGAIPGERVSTLFLYYYLLSKDFGTLYNGSAVPQINNGDIDPLPFPLPPLSEQHFIVSYLDDKCGKIDEWLSKKQNEVEHLEELKQRVIADAVTRGINPNVTMKQTNIPWLPDVPEHWNTKKGKHLFLVINECSTTGQEELLTVSDKTGITPRSMKNVTMFMSESLIGYKKCQIGDICSNIMWMWHGAVGVTKYEGVISPSYVVYRQKSDYYVDEYLDNLLRLPQLVKFYAALSKGLTESRLRLYPDAFLNIVYIFPPIEEQKQIVAYINDKTSKIDKLITNINKEIENIKEYKQRLISDVVTGQIKVC